MSQHAMAVDAHGDDIDITVVGTLRKCHAVGYAVIYRKGSALDVTTSYAG